MSGAAQGYIGRNPGDSQVTIARQQFTPTGVTTDFTFTSGYTAGYVDVYINGAKILVGRDYTATNGSVVGLTSAAQNGDIVEIVAYKAFNVNNVAASNGNFTVGGILTVDDNTALSGQLEVTGVSTFAGAVENVVSTGIVTALGFSGNITGAAATFTGDVSIGGTLTYEDVTNIDSVGIVTARAGVNVSGGQLLVGSGVTIGNAGVATFSGTSDVHLLDNVQLNVGDGSDLVIKHDGSNSYITDSGSGGLFIQGSGGGAGITLEDPDGNNFLVCVDEGTGGTVELYKAGSKKFETTTTGATITGDTTADGLIVGSGITMGSAGVATFSGTADIHLHDSVQLKIGDSSDLTLYHNANGNSWMYSGGNGSDLYIGANAGEVYIQTGSSANDTAIKVNSDSSVDLYYNNSKKFETTKAGTITSGIATATGLRSFGSATVAYIEARASSTQSTNTNKALRIRNNSDTDTFNISYKGSVGVGTNSPNFGSFGSSTSGIEISDVDTNNGLLVQSGTNEFYFANTSNSNYIWGEANVPIEVATNSTTRLKLTAAGDIELSGTAAGVASCTWDKSANTLIFKDKSYAAFGDSSDLKIYHDSNNTRIDNNTGQLKLRALNSGASVQLIDHNDTAMLQAVAGGTVSIAHNNSTKLSTTTTGVSVSGESVADSFGQRLRNSNTGSTNDHYWKIGSYTGNGSEGFIATWIGTAGYSNGQQISGATTLNVRVTNGSTLEGFYTGESSGGTLAIKDIRWKHEGSGVYSIWVKVGNYGQISPFVQTFGGTWTTDNTNTGGSSVPTSSTAFSTYAYKQVGSNTTIQYGETATTFKQDINLDNGMGINFHPQGGSDVNLLDDYETGTWTPTIAAQYGTIGGYTTQAGFYTKIGRLVVAQFAVKLSDKGDISGSYTYLMGMPFNHAGTRAGAGAVYYIDNMNTAVSSLQLELGGASPTVAWWTAITGTSDTETDYVTPSYFSDTTHFEGQLVYRVS